MDWESDAAGKDAMTSICRLQCPLRHNAATDKLPDDEAAVRDEVEWAGFAANLNFAFSQNQRDNVYLQHLNRVHNARQVRPDGIQVCACEIAAHRGNLDLATLQDGAVRDNISW